MTEERRLLRNILLIPNSGGTDSGRKTFHIFAACQPAAATADATVPVLYGNNSQQRILAAAWVICWHVEAQSDSTGLVSTMIIYKTCRHVELLNK